jgi:hypothetical protein
MKIILLSFLTFLTVYSQHTINIYSNNTNSKFAKFEREIIKTSFELMGKRFGYNLKINFKKIIHFKEAFKLVNTDSEKDNIHNISINSISITEERKEVFDFSNSYMPNKYVISSAKEIVSNDNLKVGYIIGSVISQYLDRLKKEYNYEFIPYTDYINFIGDLKKNKIQLIMSDYVDLWIYNLKLVEEIEMIGKDHFGVLLAKNCSIANDFKETFRYFVKTKHYYSIVKKHFGDDAVNYFKNNI